MHMEEIYTNYASQIYYYLLYLSKDADLAEELTQETFFRAVKNINKFREECSIDIWLLKIAKNTFYNYIKKNKKIHIIDNLDENIIVDDTERS